MPSVDSVDLYSIYSNAIVYCVWYLVCQQCRYEDQSTQCIECYVMKTVDTLVFVALIQHLLQSTMRCENTSIDSFDIA